MINSSEINSAKQNKPVKGIIFQCVRRQNAVTNRFEVGLDLFKKYIICLQNQNVFQETKEASSINLREQELLNEQFSCAAKLCVNSGNFYLPHFPLIFLQFPPPAQDFPGHISDPGSSLRSQHSPRKFPSSRADALQKIKTFFSSTFKLPSNPSTFLPLYHHSCPDVKLK